MNVMRDEITKRNLKINGQPSLNEALQQYAGKGLLRTQIYWIKDFHGSIPLDYIGRFETLGENFQEVCRALKLPQIILPHKIKGSGENYQEHYDTGSINIIREVYKEDIEIFGYSFES